MMDGGGIDSRRNYIGEDLGDTVVVVSKTRDSEILAECNFDAALELLGGESNTVRVYNFGHWACGHISFIGVDPSDTVALEVAYCIRQSLEDYPILDEGLYFEREQEEADSDIEFYLSDFVK
jgi:hypothetical protein